MKFDERMKVLLGRYIAKYVDQLSEGVVEWWDSSYDAGSDDTGSYVRTEITIVYKVDRDISRFGKKHHYWQADMGEIVRELALLDDEE